MLDYKSGAKLVMNRHIAADVISAKGKSYGAELMVKKVSGKLNGWVSYTYSRTMLQQNDPSAGELINRGEYYPASFDKPHNVNVIANYRFTHRFSMSVNTVYTTGRPITIPIAYHAKTTNSHDLEKVPMNYCEIKKWLATTYFYTLLVWSSSTLRPRSIVGHHNERPYR